MSLSDHAHSSPYQNGHGETVCPDCTIPLAYPNPNHPQEEWNGNGLVCPECGRRWLSDGTPIGRRLDRDDLASDGITAGDVPARPRPRG